MITILDYFSKESQDLYQTLQAAGISEKTIVLEPNGFLPEGVICPFTYFLGDGDGQPRYFNQVKVPAFWEIRGTNQSGQIFQYNREKARIYYEDSTFRRFVKRVEWLGEDQVIRLSEHYNQVGRLYAKTVHDAQGQMLTTSYVDCEERECLVENHVTGDLVLSLQGEGLRFFHSRLDFYRFFLEYLSLDINQICFNTLSTSFLLSYYLPVGSGQDFLFWQEPLGEEIPGNMRLILENDQLRCQKIIIPDFKTYQRALELVPEHQHRKIASLGYTYTFYKENHLRSEALVLTNSDQIEQLTYLVEQLPQVTFRIAALTEMSSKLLGMLAYPNVVLYQNASSQQIKNLLMSTDIFLDINYANEVMGANRQAFEHNLLLLAFHQTLHDSRYVAAEHIFSSSEAEKMVATIQRVLESLEEMSAALHSQGQKAHYMDRLNFQECFKKLGGEIYG